LPGVEIEAISELNDQQRRFVEAMLIEPNAKAAYIRAGYRARGAAAEANASRLLRNAKVSNALAVARESRAARTRVSADRVVVELAKLGFSQLTEVASWGPCGLSWKDSEDLPEEAAACIQEITFTREVRYSHSGERIETGNMKIKLHDKKAALKMLGDHLGIFTPTNTDAGRLAFAFMSGVHTIKEMHVEDMSE
jgi:phage terminase small subunit